MPFCPEGREPMWHKGPGTESGHVVQSHTIAGHIAWEKLNDQDVDED